MAGLTDHYYTARPTSASRQRTIQYKLPDGRQLSFATDSGVFSGSGVDFGTNLLIRALPPLQGRVLDLGCGYGAIGIAAACMNPGADVMMADVNERAVELCRMNWRKCVPSREGESGRRVVVSDGFERIAGEFDAIALNPPIRSGKARVFSLFAACHGRLSAGGSLYVVMQKKQGLASAAAELARLFGGYDDVARKAGYHVLQATRPDRGGNGGGNSSGNGGGGSGGSCGKGCESSAGSAGESGESGESSGGERQIWQA